MSTSSSAPGAMTRLATFVLRNRRRVLALGAAAFVLAGAYGAGAVDRLSAGGFDAPGSESARTTAYLEEQFGAGPVDLVLLVTAKGGDVDDPAVEAAGQALTAELAGEDGVADVFSYWSRGKLPPLRSTDGDQAIVAANLDGDQDRMADLVESLAPGYTRAGPVVDVRVTGYAEIFREVGKQIEKDLQRAELIAFPVTAVLLLLVFRSAMASLLPLVVGGLAMVGSLFVLRLVASVTEVSVFAVNMTIAMSFGLGIDYSLFIVSRFRDELAAGHGTEEAVVRAMATAGRTVAFSSATVAASLVALLVFPRLRRDSGRRPLRRCCACHAPGTSGHCRIRHRPVVSP
jgi:putative drug exporter of the RND superfamily